MSCVCSVYVLQPDSLLSDVDRQPDSLLSDVDRQSVQLLWICSILIHTEYILSTYIVWTNYWKYVLLVLMTYKVYAGYAMYILCMYQKKIERKSFMMLGFEPCTSCTLPGCSDRCTTSVNPLVWNSYLRRYMSSNLLVKSHLVAGVQRPAQAHRPCRRRAGPGRAATWIWW
jgi:hypothetical protein